MLAEVTGSEVNYLTPDHLGSPRVLTSQNGIVVNRRDFFPFGEDIAVGVGGRTAGMGYGTDSLRQRFTGYEKDEETGLDFAQARYYTNTLGRFNSVDPTLVSALIADPQTWNRFVYTRNNPINRVDTNGESDLPANVANFVKNQLSYVLTTAIELNISAGGFFALHFESGWGSSAAYINKNNPLGMTKAGALTLSYDSLDAAYTDWESNFRKKFPHAQGVYDAKAFVDALVSGVSGYKYNGNEDYAGTVKGVIKDFSFEFFDDQVLNPLRANLALNLGNGVVIRNISELLTLLSEKEGDQKRNQALTVIHQRYVSYANEKRRGAIRRAYSLPGSNPIAEAEADYEARISNLFPTY